MSASSPPTELPKGLTLEVIRHEKSRRYLEEKPERWLKVFFPGYVTHEFSKHQLEFWKWLWSVEPGKRPQPFVGVWPRGHGKSTNAEMAVAALGARSIRKYVLYVCATQDQADDHVQNIADMLESAAIEAYYPTLSSPLVGKHGNSKGWRRNRLRTASGLTVDAIGLDSAARGAKVEEDRPGLIVIDDIDSENDSEKVVDKKIRSLTRKILPAGAEDLAVLVIQNLVHPNSIVSKLVEGVADFLRDRIISGPIPAIEDLEIDERDGRPVITGGRSTWDGMPLARLQEILDDEGLLAFYSERMHRTRDPAEAVFKAEWWAGKNRYDPDDLRIFNKVIARWIAWDTAHKEGEGRAFSAGVVGELLPDYRLVIRYVCQARKTYDALPDYVTNEAAPFMQDFKLRKVVVEDAASGQDLVPDLRKSGEPWIRNKVKAVRPHKGGKEASWDAAALWCSRGMILLPEPSSSVPWKREFEEQIFDVKNSAYKDMADAFALLINYVESLDDHPFSQRWNKLMQRQAVA